MERNTQHRVLARTLRHAQTNAERKLWFYLCSHRLQGIKFRRQELLGPYIVDFISFDHKLIIELDGGQHNEEHSRRADVFRTQWLEAQGYKVLRFWNDEVLQRTDVVLEEILRNTHPYPSPLP